MKKVVAYINTIRVHWLVEELRNIGVQEMMVTEYFKPLSQISRFELLCEESFLNNVRSIIHKIGTTGSVADHLVDVFDFDPNQQSKLPLGQQICRLEN